MTYALDDRRGRSTLIQGSAPSSADLHFPRYNPPPSLPPTPPQDGFDVAQLWALLREHARVILGIAITVFTLTMLATLLSRMSFRSTGRLYLGELDGKGASSARQNDIDLSGGESADLGSELQILQSESLAQKAILQSGLNVSLTPANWSAPRYWRWLLSRRNPALLDAAIKRVRAVNTTLTDTPIGARTFTIRFLSEHEYEVASEQGPLGKAKLGELAKLPGLQIQLARGTQRGPVAGEQYEMKVTALEDVTRDVLQTLAVAVPKPIAQGELAKVVSLEFTSTSPSQAAIFLRELMHGYLEARQSWKTEDASAAESFVTAQLRAMQDSLAKTEQKVADFRSNTDGVALEEEAKAMVEQVSKYEEQRVQARLQVAALSDMKRALKSPRPQLEAFLFGEASDTVLQELASSLSKAQQELADLESRYSAEAPDVREQRARVDAQLSMVRNYINNRLARAQENLGTLSGVIRQFEEKLKAVPGAELGLAALARESEVYSKIYSYLLERQQQAAIVKASNVSKNRILDFPQVPRREYSPSLVLRLASAIIGLILGVAFVILRSLFSSVLQSERDVRRIAGNVPVFASVPRHSFEVGLDGDRPLFRVLGEDPNSLLAEAYRTLRTSLYHSNRSEHGTVVLVTSPSHGDGKTTSVLALAAMLAADRKRVLVIDADLRNPSHHQLLRTPQEPGLSNVLSGRWEWASVVHPVATWSGEVDSLNAGLVGSAELLSSQHFAEFLAYARRRYDVVLLDAPCYPAVSDPLVLADLADTVLTVVRLQSTPRRLAAEHLLRLASVARNYGIVINGVTPVPQYHTSRRLPELGAPVEARPLLTPNMSGSVWSSGEMRAMKSSARAKRSSRLNLGLPLAALVLVGLAAAYVSVRGGERAQIKSTAEPAKSTRPAAVHSAAPAKPEQVPAAAPSALPPRAVAAAPVVASSEPPSADALAEPAAGDALVEPAESEEDEELDSTANVPFGNPVPERHRRHRRTRGSASTEESSTEEPSADAPSAMQSGAQVAPDKGRAGGSWPADRPRTFGDTPTAAPRAPDLPTNPY